MAKRILSGFVLCVIVLLAMFSSIWLDGTGNFKYVPMFCMVLFISACGLYELYHVIDIHKNALGIVGYIMCGAYYVITFFETILGYDLSKQLFAYMVSSGLIMMFTYVLDFRHKNAQQAAFAVLGLYYVAIPFSFMYRIFVLFPNKVYCGEVPISIGVLVFLMLFFCTWGSDTFAFFAGRTFGKHKLCPDLSPKKTIEGAVGGVLGSGIMCLILGIVVGHLTGYTKLSFAFMIFGLIGGFISIFGDLSASAIKRYYKVKDYGKLIPGHGGILDRFDSFIFVCPVLYFLTVYITPYLFD